MKSVKQNNWHQNGFIYVVSEGLLNNFSNPITEIKFISTGVTLEGLLALSASLNWEVDILAKAIGTTKQTLIRNKTKRLNRKISENALEIAKLSQSGITYFGSVYSWNQWLDTTNIRCNYLPPRTIINSIRGRELIRHIITSSQHGLIA